MNEPDNKNKSRFSTEALFATSDEPKTINDYNPLKYNYPVVLHDKNLVVFIRFISAIKGSDGNPESCFVCPQIENVRILSGPEAGNVIPRDLVTTFITPNDLFNGIAQWYDDCIDDPKCPPQVIELVGDFLSGDKMVPIVFARRSEDNIDPSNN